MIDDDDSALLRKQKHFLQQVEFSVRQINREVIHAQVPDLNRESFMRLARFVSELRSRYLQMSLEVSHLVPGSDESENKLLTLGKMRRQYEEAREAFAALERAIEQGYVDIKA